MTAGFSTGCLSSGDEELQYLVGGDRDLSYYKDQATQIDYPNIAQQQNEAVSGTEEPRRIRHPRKDEIQDISLEGALRTALQNAEVIRDNAQFLNGGNRLLSNPDFASSIHDVAIQESNTLFGQGGVQAALAEFDATFTANMTWGASEQPAESGSIGVLAFDGQRDEFGDFRAEVSKIFADSGSFTLEHNIIYTETKQSRAGARPFGSQFSSRPSANQDGGLPMLGLEYRRPLWQGAGTEYTRIAGPIARRPTLQSTPTVNQGVVIARIRTDITLVEFESAVAQLLKDVEDTYWGIYLAYRTYDAESVAANSALQTWREVRANMKAGKVGAADEAQARDNYFETRARREGALSNLFTQEVRLRRLMGLPVNDGTVLRPIDDPVTAQILPDWNNSLAESLTNRPEIRRQKWNIKSLELQRSAAEKLVNPRLDFVARYQMNGFGDALTGGGGGPFNSAYDTLLSGDFTGWGLGFEFSMPIGFRGATTQMQNLEHRISKARAMLSQQEQEISYELAAAFQQLDQSYQTAKTNYNRRRAAQRRVEAFEAEYKVGRSTVDLVLRAQISLAQAEIAYYSSLVSYNQSLNELRFRKGTLLMDNSVFLSESLWTEDAYDDALRRAWERSFAFDSPNQRTEPGEFVDDCIDCLDSANGEFDYHNAIPMEEELPPTAPGPMSPPAVPPPAPENRSALMPGSPEAGGLSDSYDEVVPEVIESLDSSLVEPIVQESTSEIRSSVVPAPPVDDESAPLLPAGQSDPFGRDEFVPPMPIDGQSRSGAMFKTPLSGTASRSQLLGGSPLQSPLRDSRNEFEAPVQAVEDSSPALSNRVTVIPTFDDEYSAEKGLDQASAVSANTGGLQTSSRESDGDGTVKVRKPAAKKSISNWGRFFRRE